MSANATLQAMCIEKAIDFLKSGAFNGFQVNPFSRMSTSVVQDLLSCMRFQESELSRASIAQSRLLLTSGMLGQVDVPRSENEEDLATLLRILSRGCRNLRTLSVLSELSIKRLSGTERAFRQLLRNCARLEHFHSSIFFEPTDLRGCTNLKTLRLHFGQNAAEMFSRRITSDMLRLFRSVETFALCLRRCSLSENDMRLATRTTVLILENCPRVTSLGFLESSAALEELNGRDLRTLGTPRQFQLRRCYWMDAGKPDSEICDRIRVAALCCPLVEVLVIEALHAGCLRHLTALKNLTCLHILFGDGYDYGQEFDSLLREIGPQLRHLNVYNYVQDPLFLQALCGNCPNLETLDLNIYIPPNFVRPPVDLRSLKRLKFCCGDGDSVFVLLSDCLHLKALILDCCGQLDDATWQAILQKNPLTELEVALINVSYGLPESGLRRFLQSAVKLRSICFISSLLGYDDVVRCVRDMNPSVECHRGKDFSKFKREYFPDISRGYFPDISRSSCWL